MKKLVEKFNLNEAFTDKHGSKYEDLTYKQPLSKIVYKLKPIKESKYGVIHELYANNKLIAQCDIALNVGKVSDAKIKDANEVLQLISDLILDEN